MDYLVGDLQGCCDAFDRLLARIGFSPSRDHVFVLGDLVNRGPQSLATLQRLRGLGGAATCLLGNQDLHLLAVAHGVRPAHRSDTLGEILASPERDAWVEWIRQRRMAVQTNGWLLVHAGVVPQWDLPQTLALAAEFEGQLRGDALVPFLHAMYGDEPARWSESLTGLARMRFVADVLTRIRFVGHDGTLDLVTKEGGDAAPPGLVPWFDAPGRRTAGVPIAFGHWSTFGLIDRPDLLAIDTGCVWGGSLTGVRVDGGRRAVVQVRCEAAQTAGAGA